MDEMPPIDPALAPEGAAVHTPPEVVEPDRYEVRRAVAVVPADYEKTVVVRDGNGRPVADPETGRPRTLTLRITPEQMRAVVADANERAARGNRCPITFGHTRPHEPDEEKQPRPVGFLLNYRIGPIVDHAGAVLDPKPHVVADEYLDRAFAEDAKGYPHRSVEFDPDFAAPWRTRIDGLALLRRPPECEMGYLNNQRDPDGAADIAPDAGPDLTPDGEEGTMDDETMAGDDAPLTVGALKALFPDLLHAYLDGLPAEAEAAPDQPVQNEASAPGATNTFIPAMAEADPDEEEPVHNCPDSKTKVMNSKNSRGSDPLRDMADELARLRTENARLKGAQEVLEDEVIGLKVHNDRQKYTAVFEGLANEGYRLDPAKEVDRLFKLDESLWADEIERIRVQNARDPLGRRPVDTAHASAGGYDELTEADRSAIKKIAMKQGLSVKQARAVYNQQRSA